MHESQQTNKTFICNAMPSRKLAVPKLPPRKASVEIAVSGTGWAESIKIPVASYSWRNTNRHKCPSLLPSVRYPTSSLSLVSQGCYSRSELMISSRLIFSITCERMRAISALVSMRMRRPAVIFRYRMGYSQHLLS